jgi:nicotinamidase-related amidase
MPEIPCSNDRAFSFDLNKTAVIAIDMQRDFIDNQGMAGVLGEDITQLQSIVQNCRNVLNAARNLKMQVIHTREGYQPDLSDMNELKRSRKGDITSGPLGRFLIRGEPGHDFIDGFHPNSNEPVFDKPGFSAFYKTELETYLKSKSITHLILFGVTSQCCVQSTLREAVDRGYYCLTLEDCCAAYDPLIHEATFLTIRGEGHLFGWVSSGQEFLNNLK